MTHTPCTTLHCRCRCSAATTSTTAAYNTLVRASGHTVQPFMSAVRRDPRRAITVRDASSRRPSSQNGGFLFILETARLRCSDALHLPCRSEFV